MIAYLIGVFFFVQAITLVFVLSLGKSAALADRQFALAWLKEQNRRS